VHGAGVWPVEVLSRLEPVWVMDTPARDLVTQLTSSPSGGGCADPDDPYRWNRCPGW
jgi:hypothetical protein